MIKPLIDRIRAVAPKKFAYAFIAAFVATVLLILVPSTNANAGTYNVGTATTVSINAGGAGGADQGMKSCADANGFVQGFNQAWNDSNYITSATLGCSNSFSSTTAALSGNGADVAIFSFNSTSNGWSSCPAGSAVNGFRISGTSFIYDVGIICRNLLNGSETFTNLRRGTTYNDYRCASGSYVTGIRARTGNGMDQFTSMNCKSITYSLATPTISSVTDSGASLTVNIGNTDSMTGTIYEVRVYDSSSNTLLATSPGFMTSSTTLSSAEFYCGRGYKVEASARGVNGGNGSFEIASPYSAQTTVAADTGCNPGTLTVSTGADSNIRWNASTGKFDAITKGAASTLNNETLRARLQTGASGTAVTITPNNWIVMSAGVSATANACGDLTILAGETANLSGSMDLSSCTNSGAAIKVAAAGYVYQNSTWTTKAGPVTFLSNSDNGSGANAGGIYMTAASSITTNGGSVIFAGGSTSVTTGYARGYSTAHGTTGLLDGNPTIDNAGIYVAGDISTGVGSITMNGQIGSGNADSAGVYVVNNSSLSASGNITIKGLIDTDQTDTVRSHRAVRIGNAATPNPSIASTGSGSISITAITSASSTAQDAALFEGAQISSVNGNISIVSNNHTGTSVGIYFATTSSSVTTTGTGNISITSNSSTWGDTFTYLTTLSAGGSTSITTAKSLTLPNAWSSPGALNFTSSAGSVTLNANQSVTGSGNAFTVKAAIDIFANNNITTAGGAVTLWSDTDAATSRGGGISVAQASTISTSGGAVSLSGGTDNTTSWAKGTAATNDTGVQIFGAITAGAGAVTVRGEEGANPSTTRQGIQLLQGSSITTTSGVVTLNGKVDAASTNTSNNHYGVWIGNNSATRLVQ